MTGETQRLNHLLALLCLACAVALTLLFLFLSSENDSLSALRHLLVDMIPHVMVALLAIPVVYFFLQRQGVFPHGHTRVFGDAGEVLAKGVGREPFGSLTSQPAEPILGTEGKLRWKGTISWPTACAAVDGLMGKIQDQDQGYAFDCIVTLADGGLIVADLLLFNRKFRAGCDLFIPIICLNLRRTFGDRGKIVEVDLDSYPIEYARRFSKLLLIDEASRSGKTIDATIQALQSLYENRGIPSPEMRVAVLGALEGGSPYTHYYELTLHGGETYPWGPFAEYWRKAIH